MSIDYVLRENPLTAGDEYCAAVKPIRTLDLDDLVEHICHLETTVSEADVRSVLANLFNVVERAILGGMNVCTPLVHFGASIRGPFVDDEDRFDPARHQLVARAGVGPRLRRTVRLRGRTNRLEVDLPAPKPKKFLDAGSGALNSAATPGGTGRLTGRLLQFDASDPLQGLFFVAGDGSETRVEILVENLPGKLIFSLPALAPGDYRLEVRARVNGGDELRRGGLAHTLSVS